MQWNAKEKAWAKQHGVNLGKKTAGGLSTNAAYKKITGGGGKPKPQGGKPQNKTQGGYKAPANLAQKAANWSQAQKSWLAANDPAKLKAGLAAAGQKGQAVKGSFKGTGGLIQGRQGGPQQAFGAGAPNMPKHGAGTVLGGGALAGGAAGWGALGTTVGNLAPFGPVGVAAGAGLLAMGLLGSKKSNKQFEGTIQTGGAAGFKQGGGHLAKVKDNYVPTKEEFTQHGRWLLPQDEYAHDYGRTFSEKDAQYYDNFKKQADAALASGNKAKYKQILASHGFETPAPKKEAPKKKSAPAPEPEPIVAPPKREDPVEVTQPERDFVTPPPIGGGLEETILTEPDIDPGTGIMEPPVSYLDPEDNAPGSGYGEYRSRRTFLTKEEDDDVVRTYLTAAG